MPTTIFRPTSPTNQNQPKVKIFNFCVFWMKFGMGANNGLIIFNFCVFWMKFGMGANNGIKTTENEF